MRHHLHSTMRLSRLMCGGASPRRKQTFNCQSTAGQSPAAHPTAWPLR